MREIKTQWEHLNFGIKRLLKTVGVVWIISTFVTLCIVSDWDDFDIVIFTYIILLTLLSIAIYGGIICLTLWIRSGFKQST